MTLNDKKILVTGGAGFLGSVICNKLQKFTSHIYAPRSSSFDLTQKSEVSSLLKQIKPDLIIHCAAKVGGIGANKENPASFFYDNLMMGVNIIHEAHLNKVAKTVIIGTICSYPKYTTVPIKEADFWKGYPEETNAPYGLAKKVLAVQAEAYQQQFGFKSIYLMPTNLYGPKDNFDDKSSHVIPALIKKFFFAKQRGDKEVVVWGDGSPTREFLYVEDAADGIILACEKHDNCRPVNLAGSGEVSIAALARNIANIVGYQGSIVFDASKPNGQPRRKLDGTLAANSFGFVASTSLEQGLKNTIDWYSQKEQTLTF